MSTTNRPSLTRLARVALAGGAATLTLTFFGTGVAHAEHRGRQTIDQDATVRNRGTAIANTGFNFAVGNASENRATSDQDARARSGRRGDAVAGNNARVSNNSDGSASIRTGDATAVNSYDTTISQRARNSR
ncbi:MAG: hypothetical protein M3P53_13120 [Actinomycetota bacterium]|nr:hypothetical protein [Actinomycetota bacterium]